MPVQLIFLSFVCSFVNVLEQNWKISTTFKKTLLTLTWRRFLFDLAFELKFILFWYIFRLNIFRIFPQFCFLIHPWVYVCVMWMCFVFGFFFFAFRFLSLPVNSYRFILSRLSNFYYHYIYFISCSGVELAAAASAVAIWDWWDWLIVVAAAVVVRHSISSFFFVLFIKFVQIFLEFCLIIPKQRGVRIQRTFIIRFAQQRLNRQQNRSHIVQCWPFILKNVQAYCPR